MLGRWFRESLLVCAFAGPPEQLSPVEKWSVKHSDKMTPDQLIVASIINSIAKNFEAWKLNHFWTDSSTLTPKAHRNSDHNAKTSLSNKEKDCTVTFLFAKSVDYYDGNWVYNLTSVLVSGVEIDLNEGQKIIDSWEKIRKHRAELKRVADEAKRKMEHEKKKWDVAEKLIGMRRNEHGALVPKEQTVEASHTRESVS